MITPRARGAACVPLAVAAIVGTLGCAAARPAVATPSEGSGVHHVVQPGQTMWRIARAYGVPVDVLARRNAIPDPAKIAVGQRLFVPGAVEVIDVPVTVSPARSVRRFAWPVSGREVLSRFGEPRGRRRHEGLDIRGRGGEPILAADAGRVTVSSARHSGYGKLVVIDHGDGFETRYAHGRELLVRVGERVARGQTIARVGRSGNATTDHCHFEIRQNRRPVDPLPHLTGGDGP